MACKYELFGQTFSEEQVKQMLDDDAIRTSYGFPMTWQVQRNEDGIATVFNSDGTPSKQYEELASQNLEVADFVLEALDAGFIESLENPEVALAYWLKANAQSAAVLVQEEAESFTNKSESIGDFTLYNSTVQPPSRFTKIADTIDSQMKRIQEEIARINVAMRSVNDATELKNLLDQKDYYKTKLEEKKAQLEYITGQDFLEAGATVLNELLVEAEEILTNGNVTDSRLDYVNRIIRLAQKAGDFSSQTHIFFTPGDLNDTEQVEKYIEIRRKADELNRTLAALQHDSIQKFVSQLLGEDVPLEKIISAIADASWLRTRTLSLNRMNDKLISAIAVAMKKAFATATLEANNIGERVDELLEKALPKLTKINADNPFEIFMQKINGKYTRNLVFRFSQAFFDEKKKAWRKFSSLKRAMLRGMPYATEAALRIAHDKAMNWMRDNTILFDVRKLFPTQPGDVYQYKHQTYSQKFRDAHIAELKAELGEEGFNYYYTRVEERIEHFKIAYQAAVDRINADASITNKAQAIEYWDKQNSPYYYAKATIDSQIVSIGNSIIDTRGGEKYTHLVPRRITVSGHRTEWYDKDFEKIQSDPDILNFYNYLLDTLGDLNMIIPDYKKKRLQRNSLPFIRRDLVELFSSVGMAGLNQELWGKFMEGLRTDDLSKIDYTERDPLTNKPIPRTIFHSMDSEDRVTSIYDEKVMDWRLKNPNSIPQADLLRAFYLEASDEVAREQSWDLGKVLKAYSMYVLAYKHKTMVEDSVNLAVAIFKEREELETNAAGQEKVDKEGNPVQTPGLDNLNAILDYNIHVFYGKNRYMQEGKTGVKVLTSKEKAKKRRLEKQLDDNDNLHASGIIDDATYEQNKTQISKQLDDLGGVLTASKVGDTALKWTILRAMGWNLFGGISNLGFGTISNFLEASDGRLFSMNTLMRAYSLVMHSVKRNLSAHTLEDDVALKIRNVMDKLDISKDASNEMYKASRKSAISGRLRFLEPMQITKRTEYVNQAPIMIAVMMETKVRDIVPNYQGDESVWDAIDKDGNFLDDAGLEKLIGLKIKIDSAIAKTHGNYDFELPILGKQTWIGRALLMFRTWALEGFATRFEAEGYDDILKQTRKGRYLSYGALFTNKQHGPVDNITFTILQLLGKLIGRNTNFDDRFNETDAANLRANMTELLILMGVLGAAAMLRFLKPDDDEEDEKLWVALFLLNQLNRMQTDLLFYTSVTEFEKLSQNALPVFDLVIDSRKWVSAVIDAIKGEDEIESGIYKGDSNLLLQTLNIPPFGTQIKKMYVLTKQDMN